MFNCLQTSSCSWQHPATMSSAQAAELQSAIQLGNVEQSQLLARQLAEAKAKVIVRLDDGSDALALQSDMIRYRIFFKFQFFML